ncbi:hypothetical protein Tco_0429391 [Tanacetum coccineum]
MWKFPLKSLQFNDLRCKTGNNLCKVLQFVSSFNLEGMSFSSVGSELLKSLVYRIFKSSVFKDFTSSYLSLMRYGYSSVESIELFRNSFTNQPKETNTNDLEFDDGSVDTPLVSPFLHSDNDSDDKEVLNELIEYENARTLRRERIINNFDGDDFAFECMIGFRKFTAYLDPFLPMNIISRKAYNTIMVDGLEGMGKNLVSIVKDVYMFVESFTYIVDFVVLEDIGEFIMSDMAEVLMGRPFRKITKLKYDVVKGLVSFTKIFNTYTYRMPRIIPRLKNFN